MCNFFQNDFKWFVPLKKVKYEYMWINEIILFYYMCWKMLTSISIFPVQKIDLIKWCGQNIKGLKKKYSSLPITRTLANSNPAQTWTKTDFPSITRAMLWAPDKSKKEVHCSPKHWIYFNNHVFSVCSFWSVQIKYSVRHWEIYQALKCECYLNSFPIPFPHSFGYLLRTPDNSNFRYLD